MSGTTELMKCPVCSMHGVALNIATVANFTRCQRCHQAVKRGKNGRLEPWLNIWKAGTKTARRELRKKGNRR